MDYTQTWLILFNRLSYGIHRLPLLVCLPKCTFISRGGFTQFLLLQSKDDLSVSLFVPHFFKSSLQPSPFSHRSSSPGAVSWEESDIFLSCWTLKSSELFLILSSLSSLTTHPKERGPGLSYFCHLLSG